MFSMMPIIRTGDHRTARTVEAAERGGGRGVDEDREHQRRRDLAPLQAGDHHAGERTEGAGDGPRAGEDLSGRDSREPRRLGVAGDPRIASPNLSSGTAGTAAP